MILHSVYFTFRADTTAQDRQEVIRGLANFSASLDGAIAFDAGPNLDFEQKSQAFRDGFVIRFRDADALKAYAVHATHQMLGARLCDLCENGADGIMVFDLDVTD